MLELEERLRSMCRAVAQDPDYIGVLSTGERCAVALILDKPELLDTGDTMLYAASRVGDDWLAACLRVQMNGWRIS